MNGFPERASLIITIPGPPLAKSLRAIRRAGHASIRPTERSESGMALVCMLALAERHGARWPLEGPLLLEIQSFSAIPASWSARRRREACWRASKPDCDNLAKLVCDGLTRAGVWRDDAQVAELWVSKRYLTAGEERTEIEVRELDPAAPDPREVATDPCELDLFESEP